MVAATAAELTVASASMRVSSTAALILLSACICTSQQTEGKGNNDDDENDRSSNRRDVPAQMLNDDELSSEQDSEALSGTGLKTEDVSEYSSESDNHQSAIEYGNEDNAASTNDDSTLDEIVFPDPFDYSTFDMSNVAQVRLLHL